LYIGAAGEEDTMIGEASGEGGKRERLYLVTGAAGHLGGTLVRMLCETGAEVRGLMLPGETGAVSAPQIRYVEGDVCDRESLRPLFAGGEKRDVIVFHTAALISISEQMPPRLREVNVTGTKNVLALCREYGAQRLVHVSSVHAIPELPRGQVMREADAFSPDAVFGGYARTKAEAAQAVLEAARDGLDAVTVFPSGILGPYDRGRNHLIQMVQEYLTGQLPACVRGGYDFVDVRDVAAGCLLAAERGRRGEGYLLTGHYAEIPRLLELAGNCCGRKPPAVVPAGFARAAVPLIGTLARIRGRRPLYTAYSLRTLESNSAFSSEKAERELGYAARPLSDTVRDMVDWLQTAAETQK